MNDERVVVQLCAAVVTTTIELAAKAYESDVQRASVVGLLRGILNALQDAHLSLMPPEGSG